MNNDGIGSSHRNWSLPIHEKLIIFWKRDPWDGSQFVQALHLYCTGRREEKRWKKRDDGGV
jgi:hypothetical protein